jgi:hypothetical protein
MGTKDKGGAKGSKKAAQHTLKEKRKAKKQKASSSTSQSLRMGR